MKKPKLKVWWIPQVPMKSFEVEVPSFVAAKVLLDALAKYDFFQLENNIKPDFCNIGGLSEWVEEDDLGWCDWCHPYSGDSIADLTLEECEKIDRGIDIV